MGKAAVSCVHVAKSILCVLPLTSLQLHLLAPGMNLPHVVLDFMPVGHVGAQPCRTLCQNQRGFSLLLFEIGFFFSSISFKGCFHNKKEEGSFFLVFSTAWLCVFLFSNGKMCLCLLPVHFFLKNSKQKENIIFPILQKETKPKQTDKVQYNKNQAL